MRNVLLGALWFALVFVIGLLWFFPVDVVVASQVRTLEERTGVRVKWTGEQWSLWRSTLTGVTVTDRTGHEWLRLSNLNLQTRFGGIHVQGQADWGGITGIVRSSDVEVDVDGYPVPKPASGAIEDGRLRAHVVIEQAKSAAHGNFNLSGRGKIFIYEGPIDLSGTFQVSNVQGQASLEVLGDKLRGHGDVTFDATNGDWSRARLSGPLRIEQKGSAMSLKVAGSVDNVTITQ